jgi:hypothetical protein
VGAISGARRCRAKGELAGRKVGTAGQIRTADICVGKVMGMLFILYLAQWSHLMGGVSVSSRVCSRGSYDAAAVSRSNINFSRAMRRSGRGGSGKDNTGGGKALSKGWVRDSNECTGGDCGPHAVLMAVHMMCSRYPSLFDSSAAPSTVAEIRAISAVLVASGECAADLAYPERGPEPGSLFVDHPNHFSLLPGESEELRLARLCHLIRVDEQGPVRPV